MTGFAHSPALAFLSVLGLALTLSSARAGDEAVAVYLREIAHPLADPADLDLLMARIGDARFVLLGEASHGTSEYYTWRAKLTRRLVAEEDFAFIVVEGDWTSAYEVNRYVKDLPGAAPSARDALRSFDRWPEWMWANEETEDLVEWLRTHNQGRPPETRAGFYGMDVYAFWDSIDAVIAYFETHFPGQADDVRSAYRCLIAYARDGHAYVRALSQGRRHCGDGGEAVVARLRALEREIDETGRKAHFNAIQNARVVVQAERHFRAMLQRGAESWNERVRNFKRTVAHLAEFHGDEARAVVWAHNTHVGDARATSMATQGMENIGQLLRERQGQEEVFIVGFSTHGGTVMAGRRWGAPGEVMVVPAAPSGSYDDLFRRVGKPQALFLFDESAPEALGDPRGHRAKGVVYDPSRDREHYVPTVLAERYNAVIFIEQTRALTPLD